MSDTDKQWKTKLANAPESKSKFAGGLAPGKRTLVEEAFGSGIQMRTAEDSRENHGAVHAAQCLAERCRAGHVTFHDLEPRQRGEPLGPAGENYKLHCHRVDRPIQAASPLIGDPQRFIDDRVEFRQFCCPACGRLIENEVSRAQDPLLHDIDLTGE